MVEVSDYPLRFRRPIYQKTDSPYHKEFGPQNECSEFHKTIVSSAGFRKISYWRK